MVIALGIDTQGRKHVLGLREGATETAAVTTGLLSDLVTRGLPTDRTLLFVIDGATGLRRAIDVFGSRGVVQRSKSIVSPSGCRIGVRHGTGALELHWTDACWPAASTTGSARHGFRFKNKLFRDLQHLVGALDALAGRRRT